VGSFFGVGAKHPSGGQLLPCPNVATCVTHAQLTGQRCVSLVRMKTIVALAAWLHPVAVADSNPKPKFHVARRSRHVSTRLDTFDVSSPCNLALSSLSNSTARHARLDALAGTQPGL